MKQTEIPPVQIPQNAVHIRASRPGDHEQIAVVLNQPGVRRGTLRLPHTSPEQVRSFLERPSDGGLQLVAERDGIIVGAAGLHRQTGRRHHAAVLGMSIHDAYHRQGIGKALLLDLMDAADNWLNIIRIELTVFTDNAAAIALYETAGFEAEGVHRAYAFRDGAFADVLAMARIKKSDG
ncbi:GNAT family N-acetyltransferase [Pararhizobium sp. YC-54]|uniref:GNAT family N-acetyltransferase n=1 Tax=Pararhizobium sp. YC-54 TaxID=2986920 RepID=UPI0021F78506|nr:GNAT family N-acetyltransferase [Pararhizobium sp. YC-54]MCV9999164.1 GNAT family N-acetyltransferase [Pararhizobium sp. YC-54]